VCEPSGFGFHRTATLGVGEALETANRITLSLSKNCAENTAHCAIEPSNECTRENGNEQTEADSASGKSTEWAKRQAKGDCPSKRKDSKDDTHKTTRKKPMPEATAKPTASKQTGNRTADECCEKMAEEGDNGPHQTEYK
jgi:hypothetical protein